MIGIDNLNAYYPALKQARLAELARFDAFRFRKLDLKDRDGVAALFAEYPFSHVVHLAAQAGVRHSLTAPHDYIDSNITGFLNVLEGCRHARSVICSMRRRPRSMVPIPRCHSACRRMSTIR